MFDLMLTLSSRTASSSLTGFPTQSKYGVEPMMRLLMRIMKILLNRLKNNLNTYKALVSDSYPKDIQSVSVVVDTLFLTLCYSSRKPLALTVLSSPRCSSHLGLGREPIFGTFLRQASVRLLTLAFKNRQDLPRVQHGVETSLTWSKVKTVSSYAR